MMSYDETVNEHIARVVENLPYPHGVVWFVLIVMGLWMIAEIPTTLASMRAREERERARRAERARHGLP